MIDGKSVAEVMAFARSGDSLEYDQIGYRFHSVASFSGGSPLQTLASVLAAAKRRGSEKAEYLRELRNEVQHLSFGFEPPEGRIKYEGTHHEVCFKWRSDGKLIERRVPLAFPPDYLLQQATYLDAAPLRAQQVELTEEAGIWWVPFTELLKQGRFLRMQEWSERLSTTLDPQCFYTFISHRWLAPHQPDSGSKQAALVAWQVLGNLIHAIWVGAARGQHSPRRLGPIGNSYIGIRGSGFAESILVNLLRPLQEDVFATLVAEAEQFEDAGGDFGVSLARVDLGLESLRSRLEGTPHIREILGRFRLWYDYSCMPQHPRTPEEQRQFEFLLGRLGTIQSMGRTVVLLDTVDGYFSRAWCTFESTLSAEHLTRTVDLFSGGQALSSALSSQSRSFLLVLRDRPHLVWRGILDTEVFGVQTQDACMTRLGLETTHPQDREIVYKLLRGLGAPHSIHYDAAEVLSGVFPVPLQAGKVVVVAESGRGFEKREPASVLTVDASEARYLAFVGKNGLPAFESFDDARTPDTRSGHVAILGRCEGEAILYALWVHQHRHVLEDALEIPLRSLSWVASDVAPVGYFAVGDLTVQAIHADLWVVLGAVSSLKGGYTSRILTESLWAAEIEYAEFAIDVSTNNLHRFVPSPDASSAPRRKLLDLEPTDPALTTYAGGLFRTQLMEHLGARP